VTKEKRREKKKGESEKPKSERNETSKRQKKKTGRTASASDNPYLRLLVKLFSFLARRTNTKYNKIILKRLFHSKANKAPISTSRLANVARAHPHRVAVVVGTVVDDVRLLDLPKINVAALRVTDAARARILKAGGKIYTLDQLALKQPLGSAAFLLRGVRSTRKVARHYGVPGRVGSKSIPKTQAHGRKFERARGRRSSRGFKV